MIMIIQFHEGTQLAMVVFSGIVKIKKIKLNKQIDGMRKYYVYGSSSQRR